MRTLLSLGVVIAGLLVATGCPAPCPEPDSISLEDGGYSGVLDSQPDSFAVAGLTSGVEVNAEVDQAAGVVELSWTDDAGVVRELTLDLGTIEDGFY